MNDNEGRSSELPQSHEVQAAKPSRWSRLAKYYIENSRYVLSLNAPMILPDTSHIELNKNKETEEKE